jgi:hypothetical protein
MAKKTAPPPGMKPLFGLGARPAATPAPAPATPAAPVVNAGDLVFIEPRPYCAWSSKTIRWKGHGSALVRDKYADPRLLAKDYAKGLTKTDHYADSDADLRVVTVLRGGAVKFTKRCDFPVVHVREDGTRVDLALGAYVSEKGDAVLYTDTAFGMGDTVYAGDKPDLTAVVNKPKADAVTLIVACFVYDHPEMKAHVVSSPSLAKLLGTMRAMREAVGDDETRGEGWKPVLDVANEYLRKALEKCEADSKLEPIKKKLLKADQTDWPKIVKTAFESL